MSLLKSLEFVPGVKWFDTQMHNSLFQHSVFGAIVFLVVSNTGVYKIVKDIICDVTGYKADGNTMQLIHAVVFAVIMYFGSLFILAPLLTEGNDPHAKPSNKYPIPKHHPKGGKFKKKHGSASTPVPAQPAGGPPIVDELKYEDPDMRTTEQISTGVVTYAEVQTIDNFQRLGTVCGPRASPKIDLNQSIAGNRTDGQRLGQWRSNVLTRYNGTMPSTKMDLKHIIYHTTNIFDNQVDFDESSMDTLSQCSPIKTYLDLYLNQNVSGDPDIIDHISMGAVGDISETGTEKGTQINGTMYVFSTSVPQAIDGQEWTSVTDTMTPEEILTRFENIFFGARGRYNSEGYTYSIGNFLDAATINLIGYNSGGSVGDNRVPIELYMFPYLNDQRGRVRQVTRGTIQSQ